MAEFEVKDAIRGSRATRGGGLAIVREPSVSLDTSARAVIEREIGFLVPMTSAATILNRHHAGVSLVSQFYFPRKHYGEMTGLLELLTKRRIPSSLRITQIRLRRVVEGDGSLIFTLTLKGKLTDAPRGERFELEGQLPEHLYSHLLPSASEGGILKKRVLLAPPRKSHSLWIRHAEVDVILAAGTPLTPIPHNRQWAIVGVELVEQIPDCTAKELVQLTREAFPFLRDGSPIDALSHTARKKLKMTAIAASGSFPKVVLSE